MTTKKKNYAILLHEEANSFLAPALDIYWKKSDLVGKYLLASKVDYDVMFLKIIVSPEIPNELVSMSVEMFIPLQYVKLILVAATGKDPIGFSPSEPVKQQGAQEE